MNSAQFLDLNGRRVEYQWFEPSDPLVELPPVVMLHEGLGSLSMWKDFPQRLAEATGTRVAAYSRFGYGNSDPPLRQPVSIRMHEEEALEVLPELLRALGINRPILFGHSDGASIALIYAGVHSDHISGVVALSPHVFVEEMCITSIEAAREAYLQTDMPQRLARYHRDPDGAFWLWNRVWLDPPFREWNIEHYLASVTCPVLLIQGYDDEYGTMGQLERIVRATKHTETLKLPACRHSPHRDRPTEVLAATREFMDKHMCAQASLPERARMAGSE